MDTFLDACDLPKLKQEDIKNLNRSIRRNEIEAVIKDSQQRKPQYWTDSLMNSTRF
jgi:molybdopterin-guanine dinucleotide biosynthesis protein A